MEAILTPAFSICRYSKYNQSETEVDTLKLLSNKLPQAVPIDHHTTVMHACEEIEQLRLNDQTIARDIAFLTQVIRD